MSGIGSLGSVNGVSSDDGESILFRLENIFITNDDNTNDVVDLSANDTSQGDEPVDRY